MNHPEYEFLKDIFEDVESIDSIEEKKKNKAKAKKPRRRSSQKKPRLKTNTPQVPPEALGFTLNLKPEAPQEQAAPVQAPELGPKDPAV